MARQKAEPTEETTVQPEVAAEPTIADYSVGAVDSPYTAEFAAKLAEVKTTHESQLAIMAAFYGISKRPTESWIDKATAIAEAECEKEKVKIYVDGRDPYDRKSAPSAIQDEGVIYQQYPSYIRTGGEPDVYGNQDKIRTDLAGKIINR